MKNLALKIVIDADGRAAVSELNEVAAAQGAVGDAAGAAGGEAQESTANWDALNGALAALGVGALISQFIAVNAALEGHRLALTAVLGSEQAAAQAMAYTAQLADRLGASIPDLTEQYVSLAAATKGTALEGKATRDILEAIVGAMGKLGRSSAQTSNALTAVAQMAGKGVVSMEELRGQLGEALPGAIKAMADGMGIGVQALGELIEQGKVAAEDAIPALAKGLNAAFGLDQTQRVESLTASVMRLQNALNGAFTEPGQAGLADAFGRIIDVGAVGVRKYTGAFVALGKQMGATAAFASGSIGTWAEYQRAMRDASLGMRTLTDGLTQEQVAAAQYQEDLRQRAVLLEEQARLEKSVGENRLKAQALPGYQRALLVDTKALVATNLALEGTQAAITQAEQEQAAATQAVADAQSGAAAATLANTEQQRMLADQVKDLTGAEGAAAAAAVGRTTAELAGIHALAQAHDGLAAARIGNAIKAAEAQRNPAGVVAQNAAELRQAQTDEADRQRRLIALYAEKDAQAVAAAEGALLRAQEMLAAAAAEQAALEKTKAKVADLAKAKEAVVKAKMGVDKAALEVETASMERLTNAAVRARGALAGVYQAEQALIDAQAQAAGDRPPDVWANAVTSANQAAAQLKASDFAGAAKSIEAGLSTLTRAVAAGGPAALIDATRKQLHALAVETEAAMRQASAAVDASKAPAPASGPTPAPASATGSGVDAQAQAGGAPAAADAPKTPAPDTTAATARTQVAQTFAKPIPLTFDVTQGAAKAGQEVVAAITAALAGASFSVPVRAVVTVDAGGATPTSGTPVTPAAAPNPIGRAANMTGSHTG